MSIWGNNMPEFVKAGKVNEMDFIKSGIVFGVKNGLAKLRKAEVECEDEWTYEAILKLYETPLLQYEAGPCSTSPIRLAEGYGIEKADCEELKAVDAAINSEYIDIEHSFEAVKPLLGLLEDGFYLLADAEVMPVDGDGNFFWDIDPKFRNYDASISDYYIGSSEDCDIYTTAELDPIFIYPSQSSALFNRERADYYADLFRKTDNPPRAIAYRFHGGMSVLLDGHHKATAAAMLGQKLKCLLIIPAYVRYGNFQGVRTSRFVFTDDIFMNMGKSDKEVDEILDNLKNRESVKNNDVEKEPCFADIMYRKRKWEDEFTRNAKIYPDAITHALEKYLEIPKRYDEIVNYLAEKISDKDALMSFINDNVFEFRRKTETNNAKNILALRLLFEKAVLNKDMRLKNTAMAVFRLDHSYALSADALRYLRMFRGDSEVEEMFIGIIANEKKYDKYGHIAADYWEDEK